MSTFTTPRATPTRVSSRKSAPSPVSAPAPNFPLPRLVSPRRTRPRRMRNDLTHSVLYPVTETDEEDSPSRCPSLFHAPPSPGYETHRSSLVYTPCNDGDDPFEDCTFSPVSDTFFDDVAVKAPRALRSPIRTPATPVSRVTRVPIGTSPSGQRILLPAISIIASCHQRPAPPSPPTPGAPITPTTPGILGAHLVSALRDLLTTCGEYEYDDGMFADAEDIVPGQFDDAVSPEPSPEPLAQHDLAFYHTPIASPRTPPPKHTSSYEGLLGAPRPARGPREPIAPGLDGDHSVLAGMAAQARADRVAAEAAAYEDPTVSFPSLSSISTGSSASSLNSLCGMTSGMTMAPRPPVTPPPRKPGVVSSRRLYRSPPPVWS
ncbi:hypothetical protein CspeluHIS016_0400540 [Cutaneotrichosporon spelunceum]|uniref:Uncharacterized protein n=1 Tax=Cutaneotrichosporon spelunceum TaxID=1672016 RepID=A0AAD3TVG7_9TREE|nr:hypothetical protein CspeluHIS016_0400540 [Cutaneotrichosporon spelunceum]